MWLIVLQLFAVQDVAMATAQLLVPAAVTQAGLAAHAATVSDCVCISQ